MAVAPDPLSMGDYVPTTDSLHSHDGMIEELKPNGFVYRLPPPRTLELSIKALNEEITLLGMSHGPFMYLRRS